MKSVVMIAHDFPPEGNAGAYRPLRFVRQLPALGWQPAIVTLDTDFFERYDPSLLAQIPSEIEVIRVPNRDPWQAFLSRRTRRIATRLSQASPLEASRILQSHHKPVRARLREILRSLEARVYDPDIAMGWIGSATDAVERLCRRVHAKIIWATAGPVSAFHVAERASHRTGVPYVLDFRDAWTITFNEFEARRSERATQRDRCNMFRFLKGAKSVIFRYDREAECFWRAYPAALEASKVRIIPNGFEGGVETYHPAKGGNCEVLYTGTLSDYRYDTFVDAVELLKQSFPQEAARLRCHFVGEGFEAIQDLARERNLTDILTAEAPVRSAALVQRSKQADAFLLLGRPLAMRGYELFAAAKLFGYLKLGKPIVGILPADEARRILHQVGATTVADVDSVTDIVEILRRVISSWADGKMKCLAPDRVACLAYSAERQSETLVSAFESAPSPDSFFPGQVAIPESLQEEIARREEEFHESARISLGVYGSSSQL